jgi:hypothetical protein
MPTFWKSHSNCLSAPAPRTIPFFLELSDDERKSREMLLTLVLHIRQTSAPFSVQFHSRLNKTVCCLVLPRHQFYENIKLECIIFVISTRAHFFGLQMVPQFLCGSHVTHSERGTIYRTSFPVTRAEGAGGAVYSVGGCAALTHRNDWVPR